MRVRGQKIRAVRIEKKLSQKDLANEICTQATISNIEKKGICDSLQIFSRICNRLELDMNSCIIEPTEKSIIETLQTAEKLCVQLNHKKAYKLLLDVPENTVFSSDLIFKKLLYFRGITSLLGEQNTTEALFYLHRGSEIDVKPNIFNTLSLNALGTYYELENEPKKAKVYYDKSLEKVSDFEKDYPFEVCRIYYNAAKFYSEIKKYKKSVQLSELGIAICKANNSIYLLDFLLYEKAFNTRKLGKTATEDYLQAYYFTKFFNNKNAASRLEKELKELKIAYT